MEKINSLRNTFNKIKSEIKKNLKKISENLQNFSKKDFLMKNPILILFIKSLNFLTKKNLEIFKTYHILQEIKNNLFLLMNNISFFENSKNCIDLLIDTYSFLYIILKKNEENFFFEISKNIEFFFFYLYDKKLISDDLLLKIDNKNFKKKINFIKNQKNLDFFLYDYELIFYKINNFSLKILLKIFQKILFSLENDFLDLKNNFEIFLKIQKFFLLEKKNLEIKKILSSYNFYLLIKIIIKFLSKINFLNIVYNTEILNLLITSKITIENPSFSFLIIKLYKIKFQNSTNFFLEKNFLGEIKNIFEISEKIINYLTKPKIEGFFGNRRAKENLEYNLNDVKNGLFGSEIFLLENEKIFKICEILLKLILLIIEKFEGDVKNCGKKFLEFFFSFIMSILKNATVFENLVDFLQKRILVILKKFEIFKKKIEKKNFLCYQNNLYSFLKYNDFENIVIKSKILKERNLEISYDLKNSPKISFQNFNPENFKGSPNFENSQKSENLNNNEDFKFERAFSDNIGISKSEGFGKKKFKTNFVKNENLNNYGEMRNFEKNENLNKSENFEKYEKIGDFDVLVKEDVDVSVDDISNFPKINLN